MSAPKDADVFVGGARALLRALCGILFLNARKALSANLAESSRLSELKSLYHHASTDPATEAMSVAYVVSKATVHAYHICCP